MIHPKIPLAQTVVQLCSAKGIDHVVISPGSRNAPLTVGFSNHPDIKAYSIVDERCAAFVALGMAQQLKRPVAVVCTSGSALLNYYPALSEAFYSDIPLVVISADRPSYRIDIGDGQTIRQDNVFDRHILYSTNLKQDANHGANATLSSEKHEAPKFLNAERIETLQQEIQTENEEEINRALNIAIAQKGPVHLNVPFEEPLYDTIEAPTVFPKSTKPLLTDQLQAEDIAIEKFRNQWTSAKRKMVLVGVNQPNQIGSEVLESLANDPSVLVFTETTSNLYHEHFFPSIDKIIAPIELSEDRNTLFEQLQPEILLTFGGMVVSKKVKAFLRKYQPKEHWHIDTKKAYDTYFCLTEHVRQQPNDFLASLLNDQKPSSSDYRTFWDGVKTQRLKGHDDYLKSIPFCDLTAFDTLLKTIPDGHMLQLGNSSTIRYAQLFDVNPSLTNFCNRGTSGIDGSTSTAIGAAMVSDQPVTFVTGDLSFLYDSNALWNEHVPNTFRVIVVNNGGGGIFRILPGDKSADYFETFFETKHGLTAQHLCAMYGWEYQSAKDQKTLRDEMNDFYSVSNTPKLLEVFTPADTNDKFLIDYFKFFTENK